MAVKNRNTMRARRHLRIRKKVSGTTERPRFCVSITANHIYCQFIDDVKGVTLVAASTYGAGFTANGGNKAAAREIGKQIAEKAVAQGITEVVFDRGGYLYHGRVSELAEGAREGGLKF